MSPMIIHSRIGIECVPATVVIAGNIGENPLASLGDPDVLALRIITPGTIEDAGVTRDLMNQLRLLQRTGETLVVLVVPRVALDSLLRPGLRNEQGRRERDGR